MLMANLTIKEEQEKRQQLLQRSITQTSLSALASLPKSGKPQEHEHTTFAAILITLPLASTDTLIKQQTTTATPIIISMATGTKCLPGSKRAADGSAVHDLHAEVLARRGFLRWSYDEIQYNLESSLVYHRGCRGSIELRPGVNLHLFTSHPPCGDASIVGEAIECDATINTTSNTNEVEVKRRTGAKPMVKLHDEVPVPTVVEDNEKERGGNTVRIVDKIPEAKDVESYSCRQQTGVVRRKPGKGEPTLSVSCSDKIAKWNVLGLQGALLGSVLQGGKVYLSSITVAYACEDEEGMKMALERAFQQRIASTRKKLETHSILPIPVPSVHVVVVERHELIKLGLVCSQVHSVPCAQSITRWGPTSSLWRFKPAKKVVQLTSLKEGSMGTIPPPYVMTADASSETLVGVLGVRVGRSRKGSDSVPLQAQSSLCRAALFRRWSDVVHALHLCMLPLPLTDATLLSYDEVKMWANKEYVDTWHGLLLHDTPQGVCVHNNNAFKGWIRKPPQDAIWCLQNTPPTATTTLTACL